MSIPQRPPDYSFLVTGMMCQQNCATTVQRAISSVKGVEFVDVSFPKEEALVWCTGVNVSDIINEVEDMGYEAQLKTGAPTPANEESSYDVFLSIKGMFDAVDSPKKIHEIVTAIDGVYKVQVDFDKKVCYVWGFADVSAIIDALATEGFGAKDANRDINRIKKKGSVVAQQTLLFNLDKLMKIASLKSIQASLKGIKGVIEVQVDVDTRLLTVSLATGEETKTSVLDAVTKLKYKSALVEQSAANSKREYVFNVTGMSCANCAMRIEKAISVLAEEDVPACEVSVSAMTNRAQVLVRDPASELGPRSIIDKVVAMGYGCALHSVDGTAVSGSGDSGADSAESNELAEWQGPLIVSVVLGVPVMALHLTMSSFPEAMMVFDMPAACQGGVTWMQVVMFLLNLPILLYVGFRYYKGAVLGAMHGNFGMDCLVTTGTSITFVYSCVQLGIACGTHQTTDHVFFETTGMLLMFVTVGKFIEAYAKRRSYAAISNLLKLQPREALLVVHSGSDSIKNEPVDAVSTLIPDSHSNNSLHKESNNSPDRASGGSEQDQYQATGEEKEEVTKVISLDLVQRGDELKVFPGDRIPTDGVLLRGAGFVDESMITGESMPVLKKKGDVLFGSTVNQNGVLYMRVTTLGSDSALAQIVKLVEAAQMSKAPVQAYADRLAGLFTPVILCLALVTFIVWCSLSLTHIVPASWYSDEHNDPYLFSMIFAISVVVISCPCALGLATPTAIMAGTSVGAANGILIKGGSAFETAHKIDTVIFDKTGTLTEGKLSVTDVTVFQTQRRGSLSPSHPLPDETAEQRQAGQDELLRLAAVAEQGSDHPLSRAVLEAARARQLFLPALHENATEYFVGSGVRCDTGGSGIVLVGNRLLMEEQRVSVPPMLDAAMWDLEIQGKTAVCVAVDGAIRGVLGLSDTAKPEAYSTIRALRAMGMDVWMVTGDNRTTAEALAEELDLPKERVLAGVLPRDKVTKVRELEDQGRFVAMVGDGINDSPALAQAHLGVAIGAGTEVAIEAADMVLIRNNLHDLVVALDLARVVFRRIRLNFIWATIYNFLAVPYAAGIWFPWTRLVLPPQYAGLSMAASSVSVVVSSMALWLYKRPAVLTDEGAHKESQQVSRLLQRAKRALVSWKRSIRNTLTGQGTASSGTEMTTMASRKHAVDTDYTKLPSSEIEADIV